MAFNSWQASVKYRSTHGNRRYDDVPVSCIQIEYENKKGVLKRKAFKPESVNDFSPNSWYIINSNKDVPDGTVYPFYALIGRIAESQEALSQSHKDRIKWPNVDEPNEEPETSEENSSAENSNSVMALREARLIHKNQKRKATQNKFETFMSAHTSVMNQVEEEEESVAALKAKIQFLENQNKRILAEKVVNSQQAENSSFSFQDVVTGFTNMQSEIKALVESVSTLKESHYELHKNVTEMLSKSRCKSLSYIQKWVDDLQSNNEEPVEFDMYINQT